MKLSTKLLAMSSVPALVLGGAILTQNMLSLNADAKQTIESFRVEQMTARKAELKNYVTQAKTATAHLWTRIANDPEAKKEALAIIRNMNYGSDGYVFATDNKGVMLAHHANPKLEGVNLLDKKDSAGVYFIQNMLSNGTQGGYVEYLFNKPSKNKEVTKLSYSEVVDQLGLMLGTGVYIDDIDDAVAVKSSKIAEQLHNEILRSILTALLGLAVIGAISVFAARSIKKPIGGEPLNILEVVKRVADGNLQKLADTKEKTGIYAEIDGMRKNLRKIVGQIQFAMQEVSCATNEIQQGSVDLAQRTEEQAASIEETASAMEELTVSIRGTSDNAKTFAKIAEDANAVTQNGVQSVGTLIDAIHKIKDGSDEIQELVEVMEGLAFQTNLLSLNAAVEAARVGEHGKGFAVIAGEVRKLAQSSATASKKIKSIANAAIANAQNGTESAKTVADALDKIEGANKKVVTIAHEISDMTTEQACGIEQINKAVLQMDQMTQQNAALVEEANAACDSMAGQVEQMSEIVSWFQV